jgi:hypothetical protein
MIRGNSFVLCGLIVLASAMCGVAQDKAPVTVLIQCPQSEAKSGSEVKLVITVTNTSDQDVDLYKTPGPDGQAEDVNKIEVRDASGNLLKRVDFQIVEIGGARHTVPKRGHLKTWREPKRFRNPEQSL